MNYLSTGQVAKILGVTPDTILKWIKKGQIKASRTAGGHYRIDENELILSSENKTCNLGLKFLKGQQLHCWEYQSSGGEIREECKSCLTYRVRAKKCFELRELAIQTGHEQIFCENSCKSCDYFKFLENPHQTFLIITENEELKEAIKDGVDTQKIDLVFLENFERFQPDPAKTLQPLFILVDYSILPYKLSESVADGAPAKLNRNRIPFIT